MLDMLEKGSSMMFYLSPYENPFYFIILGITLIPLVIQLLRGKRMMWYQNVLTVFFLWMSFGGPSLRQGIALLIYIAWQTFLVWWYFGHRQRKNSNIGFYSAVILAILPLFLVKVIPFILERNFMIDAVSANPDLKTIPTFIGFLGISYLTFKAVQMIMEIRDGLIKEYHVGRYLQFLIFFPTISSGPIDRYRRFEKDLLNPPDRDKYVSLLANGIQMFFMGFLYKFIIGYILGVQLLPHVKNFALEQGGLSLGLLGTMYVYSLYLFFDFAGYSLFAVGASNIMGYETPINFNKPFLSHNIKEFWNRWHMSLSFWFRDYVYMRLMFTLIKKKVFKSRIVASNVGYFALFLLMGAWHGLTWYYLVYGLYHATLICLTDVWLRYKKKNKDKIPSNRFTHGLAVVGTFHAVALSFLIFSGFLDTLIKARFG